MDSKLLVSSLLAISLSACIEVDNQDVNDSLSEQNQLLAQQNEILQQQTLATTDSVTITGRVVNLATEAVAANATIKYKVGLTWSEPVALVDGQYEISGLPSHSDIRLLVESTDESFMPREVSGNTIYADGNSYQEIPDLAVSPFTTYTFSVYDKETLEPASDLKFKGVIDYGESFSQVSYLLTATYNADSKNYQVVAPTHFYLDRLSAYTDTDLDGTRDYDTYGYYSSYVSISYAELQDTAPIYVTKYQAPTPLEPKSLRVRLSVLDSQLDPLKLAQPVVIDDISETKATYLETTGQHELSLSIDEQQEIKIPAFSENDKYYRSVSVFVRNKDETSIHIQTRINNRYSGSKNYDFELGDSDIVDIVVKPTEEDTDTSSESLATLITHSETLDSNGKYKLFFSSAVEAIDNFYSVVKIDHKEVIRGNDSEDDLILPGTTYVKTYDKPMTASAVASLNDTLLSVGATEPLEQGSTYRFTISSVKDKRLDSTVAVDQNINVNVPFNEVELADFDINAILLDNGNYYTNGSLITPQNTAGQPDSRSNNRNSAYLYFPNSILTLQNLTLQKSVVTENGAQSNTLESYSIVKNGQVNTSREFMVMLASNEDIDYNNYPYPRTGTTLTDGWHYRYGSVGYFDDDTPGNENSITFEYVYETKSGEFHTGTVTVPVK